LLLSKPERFEAEGEYALEAPAVDEVVAFIEASGMFRVYREVSGVVTHLGPNRDRKSVRVDLILAPQQKAFDHGWEHGQLAVECKRSGEKLAPAVAQARDYRSSVFALKTTGGNLVAWVAPQFLFVYPFNLPGGDLESLMASDGLGVVHWRRDYQHDSEQKVLRFKVGGWRMLELYEDGRVDVNKRPSPGRKVGAR
jgi:hypothetical protein